MEMSDLARAVVANHQIFLITNERIGKVLAAHRLTETTAQALWAIDPAETPPSMTTMAERLFCNSPNLTFIAGQLIDRGLVSRSIDPDDRRSRVLALTDEGVRVRTDLIRATLENSPFATLSPEKLRQLTGLMAETVAGASDDRPATD